MKTTALLLTATLLWGCFSNPDKKIFIKSIQAADGKRIDWYCNSLPGGLSKSYLQYEDKAGEQHTFLESSYLSDIRKQGDTLIIQVWKSDGNDYQVDYDNAQALELITKLDTTGGQWNGAENRLGRLQKKSVDVNHYHFSDSYCPNSQCQ